MNDGTEFSIAHPENTVKNDSEDIRPKFFKTIEPHAAQIMLQRIVPKTVYTIQIFCCFKPWICFEESKNPSS